MPQMGLLVDWTWLRKESLSLKISQRKSPKLESKEKKTLGNRTGHNIVNQLYFN